MHVIRRNGGRLAGVAIGILAVAVMNADVSAQSEDSSSVETSSELSSRWDRSQANGRNVRLNYLSSPWSKVLNDLAEKTGSTLVMHDVPPGKFSRQDWNKHDRANAISILNRELEPKGFRIIAKDQFLTVMEVRRTRAEYRRPVAPKPGTHKSATASNTPSSDSDLPAWATEAAPPPQTAPSPAPTQNRQVQQVTHQEDRQATPSRSVTIHPRHRSAVEIAKQIHKAFTHRSRLESAGPNGLPAFVVDQFSTDEDSGETLFTIEIDTDRNELLVTASPRVQAGVRNLISSIDLNPLAVESMPKLVTGDETITETGRQLQRPLSLIAQARQRKPQSPTMDLRTGEMIAQAAPGQAPAQAPGRDSQRSAAVVVPQGRADLPTIIGNLKSDVSIEALDELNLLILRGNEEDVERVMQVIQMIEQLAVGSLPEIHLLKLRFVDSQSLAALLNDVYEQLTDLRTESAQLSSTAVNVVPVVTPNAVLILAPGNTMEAILSLADELDQPIDPEHEVQVFRLKHAVAVTVADTLQEFYGDEPVGLGTRIRVSSDERTNSLIVQARPRDLSEIEQLIKGIDKDEAGSVSQMKIIPLKSAVADELAQFLTSAIQSIADPRSSTVAQTSTFQTQGLQNQEAKAVVLEFLAEDGQTLIRSGLLSDIRFNSDPRTNSIAITAPEQSMPLLIELVRILDQPSGQTAEIKVFPLTNADAADAVDLLNELFQVDQQQQTTGQNQTGTIGIELAGAEGSNSSLIPMRFSIDYRSNSVVAVGSPDALTVVEAVLYRLDSNDARTRETVVIKLHNNPAEDVALAINDFRQSLLDLTTFDPDRISTSQILEREIVVTPDPVTNSLIINASPNYMEDVILLVRQLDAEPAQVMIQALLVEVTLDNTDEFGVELGLQSPVLFDRSLMDMVTGGAIPGFNFNNQPLGNNPNGFFGNGNNTGNVGGQGLSNFSLGRTNDDLGYGGLVLSASSDAVNVLIRALAARRDVRVLSRPSIQALDNLEASIQVGQVVPVSDGVTITNNNVIPQVIRDPAGIILTVVPRITPDGQIVMAVAAEKSFYDQDSGVVVFADTDGSEITSPIKEITTASTTVKVPDGQTIVLGGMITKRNETNERKVPWLGDLPIVGHAFRFDAYSELRTELLIFLTPRIVRSSTDFEMIKQVESQRLHWFHTEGEELHGPLFGIPNEIPYSIEGKPIQGLTPGEYPIHGGPAMSPPEPTPSVPEVKQMKAQEFEEYLLEDEPEEDSEEEEEPYNGPRRLGEITMDLSN